MKYLFPTLLLCSCASVRQQPAASVAATVSPTTVVLRGTVTNFAPNDTVYLAYNPQPRETRTRGAKAPVSPTGSFELELQELAGPVDAQLIVGGFFETVYFTPGDTQIVSVDRRQGWETIRFAGRGAYINTYLTHAQRQFDYAEPGTWPEDQYTSLPPAEYRARVNARLQQQLDTLAAYHARQPLPDALQRSRRQVLAVRHATSLLRYVTAQKIKTRREPQLPVDYYNFLSRLPLREFYYPNCASSLADPLAHFIDAYISARLLPPGGQLPTVPGTAERIFAQATADFGETPARDEVVSNMLARELYGHSNTGLAAVQAIMPTFRSRTHDSVAVRTVRQALRATMPLQAGNVAPDFRLVNTEGKSVALRDFRGKVVYLDFWYSHCAPCLAEAPAAAVLKKQFLRRDVVFLYVSIDEDAGLWQRTLSKHALASPNSVHLLDKEGWQAARPFHVGGYPSYWIIGRDGRIRQGDAPRPSAGATTVAALEQALAE